MSIVDGELPFALVDLTISVVQTVMGAILMCISAGYFTLTMPVVGFVVWGTASLPSSWYKTDTPLQYCKSSTSSPPVESAFSTSKQSLPSTRTLSALSPGSPLFAPSAGLPLSSPSIYNTSTHLKNHTITSSSSSAGSPSSWTLWSPSWQSY